MNKVIIVFILLIAVLMTATFTRGLFTPKRNTNNDLIITGHRGGADLGEENSLCCIERGVAAGAHSIEIDVHITSDGEVVVCHDPTVDRTTNGSGKINAMTLAQIKALRLIDSTGKATEQQIPTLVEVLELLDGRVEFLLEIKRKQGNNPGIEEQVLAILNRHSALEYTTIQSFDDSVLERLHALDPSLKLEKLLFGKVPGIPIIIDGNLNYFSTKKYHYIRSFNFHHRALSGTLSRYLHKLGFRTRIWTFNNPDAIPDIPLEGIITNCPDRFLK